MNDNAEAIPREGRARPMSPDTRRAMIVDATIPLILEHGADVTTRQIAHAAGIAEGTVFRAFADKAALVDACVERVMDTDDVIQSLRLLPRGSSLDETVSEVVEILMERVSRVVAFMGALGPREHERHRGRHEQRRAPLAESTAVVADLLSPHSSHLRVSAQAAAEHIRLLVVGSAVPFLRAGAPVDTAALTSLILYGVAGNKE